MLSRLDEDDITPVRCGCSSALKLILWTFSICLCRCSGDIWIHLECGNSRHWTYG